MQVGALAPYEQALRDRGPLGMRTAAGRTVDLDVERWLAPVDEVDLTVLERCDGPVLDVGCGPGRFVSSLTARGVSALGVDIAETAVASVRALGLPVLRRDVFAAMPGEGRWPTILLLDGNIGIGGDPLRLLTRVRSLLRPGGRVVIESDPAQDGFEALDVRFTERGRPVGPYFPWAQVGRDALLDCARRTGYSVVEVWSSGGRDFAVVERACVPARAIA